MTSNQPHVRTRFAPSPTGFLHVGGIRTALFAYLVAKQAGGEFILRLEDTDKKREVEGSGQHIIDCLTSLGLDPSEGPGIGGDYGPYKQSDRLEVYQEAAQRLIAAGRAYADPYTAEELQEFREQAIKNKRAFRYRDYRPENPPAWDGSMPLRFKSEPTSYSYHDEVMGDITTSPEVVDDFILIKSDGYPTYNFAHIVDDASMQISHVIRGQEFLSSMPNYLALYEALGINRPIFAHMPHVMNQQGNKKLGKRDGAKDVLDYLREGYLPETMVSFIATLGWNDGTEQEVFTHQQLVDKFSLARVQKSGARFDEKRLLWMNGHFIRQLSLDQLAEKVAPFWSAEARAADNQYRTEVLTLAQDRLKTLQDLPLLTSYFFTEPNPNMELITGNKQLKKLSADQRQDLLQQAHDALATLPDWTAANIQQMLNELLEITGQKPGSLFSLIRIATTWAPFSPELDTSLELLGKAKTLARINQASALH